MNCFSWACSSWHRALRENSMPPLLRTSTGTGARLGGSASRRAGRRAVFTEERRAEPQDCLVVPPDAFLAVDFVVPVTFLAVDFVVPVAFLAVDFVVPADLLALDFVALDFVAAVDFVAVDPPDPDV